MLVDLFVVLLAAKLGDELFKRIHQPAVIGEMLGGLLVGPSVLGLVEMGEVLEVFAELGVVFLLFWVGLETRISQLREVGRHAALTGILGALIPLACGVGLGLAIGEPGDTSIFIGAALVATSVGITSAVLIDLDVLGTRRARTILGAGIVDDIIAMVVLAVAVGVAETGKIDIIEIVVVAAIATAFVVVVSVGGTQLLARRPQMLRAPRFSDSPLMPAVLICLGLAAFAAQIGLAAIIGAFLAGVVVAETKEHDPIEEEVAPLYAFFPPFFFAAIGIQVDLGALASGAALALLVGLTVVAIASKAIGARIGSRGMGQADSRFIAAGMVPRGEMGVVIAGIGAGAAVIDERLFGAIVGMAIVTTILAPPLLRRLNRDCDP